MAVSKVVGFDAPYVAATFQAAHGALAGADGYLGGGAASDDGVNVTVQPYSFLQRGIVCADDAVTVIPVPSGGTLWFVVASTVDDDVSSGVELEVVGDAAAVGSAVVIAWRANGTWYNPMPLSTRGAFDRDASEQGPESGFQTFSSVNSGVVAALNLNRGTAVGPDGERREFGGGIASEPARLLQVQPMPPHATGPRTDYLVLRKRESGSEVLAVMGNALGALGGGTASPVLESGPGVTRPSIYAPRAGGYLRVAAAWGNGTNLRLFAAIGSVLGATTIYAAAASVSNVWIAGQRASDGMLLIVFSEGNQVKVGAFNFATGAPVDAPTRIDTQPNACIHTRAVLDLDGLLHVVYQHDEGGAPPNQQIYYTRVAIASGARFGTPALAPRLVNKVNSTRNDTWPSLGVDRARHVHIAHATGNSADEFGQLRYVELDPTGAAVSRSTYATFGAGSGDDPNDPNGLVTATASIASIRQPQVVVTPHDEVNIAMIATRVGATVPDVVGLFNPTFQTRLGYAILVLSGVYANSGAGVETLQALGVVADEVGQLLVVANWSISGVLYTRLDTAIAPRGLLGESYLETSIAPLLTAGTDPELVAAPGPTGDVLLAFRNGPNASWASAPTRAAGLAFTPHRDDVYLGGWVVDADGVGNLNVAESGYQIFNTRPKRMNYPVLVGDQGDYVGCASVLEALSALGRRGAHIVVRGGEYVLSAPVRMWSGVRIEGEGEVSLNFALETELAHFLRIGIFSNDTATATGSVVTVFTAPALSLTTRLGDLCELFDGTGASLGVFLIRRILDDTRFVIDGVPSGVVAAVNLYACGASLQNVTIKGTPQAGADILRVVNSWGAELRQVRIVGSLGAGSAGVRVLNARGCRLQQVDVTGIQNAAAGTFGISLEGGSENLVEASVLGAADGRNLHVSSDSAYAHVRNCDGNGVETPWYVVDASRATPLRFFGNEGVVDGADGTLVALVGKRIVAPRGKTNPVGALQFEDENTDLYGGGPIDFSGPNPNSAAFNGATPRALIPSVNERFKKTGDTLSGDVQIVGAVNIGSPSSRVNSISVGTVDAQFYDSPITTTESGTQPQLLQRDAAGNIRGVVDHNGYPTARNCHFREEWVYPTTASVGFPADGAVHNLPLLGARWNGITTAATASRAGIADPTSVLPGRQLVLNGNGDVAVGGTAIYTAGPILAMATTFLSVVFFWEMVANAGGDQNSQWFTGLGDGPNDPGIVGTNAIAIIRRKTDLNWHALTSRRGFLGADLTDTGVVISASSLSCKVEVKGPGLPSGPSTKFYLNDNLVATQGTFYPTGALSWINQINCVQSGVNNTGQLSIGPINVIWNRQLSSSTV